MLFFSCNALKYVLINNEECKKRTEIIIINSNEHSFYTYSIWLKLLKRQKFFSGSSIKLCW